MLGGIRERVPGLEDLASKESHEGKTLLRHVEECLELIEKLSNRLGISPEARRIACALAIVHDIGKALPEWNLDEKKVRHSEAGALLLSRLCDYLGERFRLEPKHVHALIYFTWRHHSTLRYPRIDLLERSSYLKRRWSEVQRSLWPALRAFKEEFKDVDVCLELADAVGVFKLADIVSAAGLDASFVLGQYTWPEGLLGRIVDVIRATAEEKKGRFDEAKFKQQLSIANRPESNVIVAAPTGWGKTALALLRAGATKPTKVFYVLPTITAIKEFYEKIQKIFGEGKVGEYFYFADVELLKEREEEYGHVLNLFRYFVPKVVVTTVDQVLFTALQVGKYHLRRFNFRNALLVLDEFHLLTTEMVAALRWLLEIIQPRYRLKLLLMSATPAGPYVEYIKHACADGVKEIVLRNEYAKLKRHKVELVTDKSVEKFLENNLDLIRGKLERGERLLVIVNNVDRAITIYDLLKEELKGYGVNLIHSRFAYIDRIARETAIGTADVLIATQVAEVSLDISFDSLITDLAPLPSLIQRFGRVNRYARAFRDTNVWICAKLRSSRPYATYELRVTEELLQSSMLRRLEEEGEIAYVEEVSNYWEFLGAKDRIDEHYHVLREDYLEYTYGIYHISRERYEEALSRKLLGRDLSVLVFPRVYSREAKRLIARLREEKDYRVRRRLYALVKQYLASVPLSLTRPPYARWDDELQCYVVGSDKCVYSKERGFVVLDSGD